MSGRGSGPAVFGAILPPGCPSPSGISPSLSLGSAHTWLWLAEFAGSEGQTVRPPQEVDLRWTLRWYNPECDSLPGIQCRGVQMPEKTLPQVRPARLRPVDRTHELAWIAEHGREYQDQWVVLDGNRLIAHGSDPQPLLRQARAQGVERPLVTRIDQELGAFTGGWL